MKTKRNIIFYLMIMLLVSTTGIILEISLSRLFSYMLSYHFVFIIIAFTLFGLGIGEMMYYRMSWLTKRIKLFYFSLPISILFSYVLMVSLNKTDFILSPGLDLLINVVFAVIPFVNVGIVKADIFQTNKTKVSWFYGLDSLGSATGALLSVIILNNMGLPEAFLVSYILFSISGLLLCILLLNQKLLPYKTSAIWAILAIGFGWLSFSEYQFNPTISRDNDKDMLRLMNNPAVRSRMIATEWNSFGRTDLVELTSPGGSSEKVMFIDGAAGTDLISIDELESDPEGHAHKLMHFPAAFELNFLNEGEKDTVLIIGPGGGIDIAATWLMGFRQIDAAEINPSFVRLMKKYNPSTFTEKENIAVYVNEGRNFVRQTNNKYDVIMLTIPVTKGGRGADFYGLTENYLFTHEAVKDYLEALTPEGRLVFTMHNPMEVYRMLSNYLKLMEAKGTDSEAAMKHVQIYSNGMMPVLVLKKQPFEKSNVEVKHILAHQAKFDRGSFFFPYVPQIKGDTVVENKNYQWYMFDNLVYGISQNEFNYRQISEAALLNLYPVSDDSPYFFNYENGIPKSLNVLFLFSLIIIAWVIYKTAKGWKFKKELPGKVQKKIRFLIYMILILGICYFFVQSYLFQVLNLQLSNPAQSFSLLLLTFLAGNGLGSFFTGLFRKNFLVKAGLYSLIVAVVMIVLKIAIIPGLSINDVSQSYMIVLLLIPAFFIGIPFPSILKELSGEQEYILPLFLGISSLVSMATAVMVIVISMLWGNSYILWLGITGYILVAVSLTLFHRNNLKTNKNA